MCVCVLYGIFYFYFLLAWFSRVNGSQQNLLFLLDVVMRRWYARFWRVYSFVLDVKYVFYTHTHIVCWPVFFTLSVGAPDVASLIFLSPEHHFSPLASHVWLATAYGRWFHKLASHFYPENPIFSSRAMAIPGTFTGRRSNWRVEASITYESSVSFIPGACKIHVCPYLTQYEQGTWGLLDVHFSDSGEMHSAPCSVFFCIQQTHTLLVYLIRLLSWVGTHTSAYTFPLWNTNKQQPWKKRSKGKMAPCPDCDKMYVF